MSLSPPPTSILPIFIPQFWRNTSEIITLEYADNNYLSYPIAQGNEKIPNLLVSGTTSLANTSVSNLTAISSILQLVNSGNLRINNTSTILAYQQGQQAFSTSFSFTLSPAFPSANYVVITSVTNPNTGRFLSVNVSNKLTTGFTLTKRAILPATSGYAIATETNQTIQWFAILLS